MAESIDKKAFKAGLGYTVGNILIKGISFISVPVFARILTVGDYGIVNTFTAYVSIISIIISFALHSSIKNAKIDYRERLKEYESSLLIIILINALFLSAIALLFGNYLFNILSLEKSFLVELIVIESFGLSLITYYNCVLSVDYRFGEYLVLSLLYSGLGIGLSIIFALFVFPSQRWLGRILGTLISALIIATYIIIRLFKSARPTVNTEFWKYGLRISLPIVPHGLSQIVLSQFDRLMINSTIGSEKAGLYSFAYNIGSIFSVVSTSLDTAWSQWFFDQMSMKKYEKINKVANLYCSIVAIGAVILLLISPELIMLMGGKKYTDSVAVSFPIVLAMFFSYMYYFPASIEYYYKKTKLIAIGTVTAAISNIALNAVYIPRFGYIAAAYTTVACYFIYYIAHTLLSYFVHGKWIYDIKVHFAVIALVTIIMFLCLFITEFWIIRYSILLVGVVLIGIIGIRNKECILNLIKDIRNKKTPY